MAQGCYIGIDQGSSATKALVMSTDGQVLFQTRKDLSSPFREGLRIEQDPKEILASVKDVLSESMRSVAPSGLTVLGIGLACQRSSCLVWDGSTGEPLSPLVSWRDTRGSDFLASLSDDRSRIFEISGLPLTPYYSASKLRWLKENGPANAAAIYGTLISFLSQNLTGNAKALVDHTNAARTQLMNIRSLEWDTELLERFGLDSVRLPEISPVVHHFGAVRIDAIEAPLLACIGDQQAAMVGLGVLENGDGGINYGTGGFLMVNTGRELKPAKGLMASVHYSTDTEQQYLLEGSVNAVGEALEWLRSGLHLFNDYEEVDDLCWKATTDLVAFIALNGTGAPHWEPTVSTSLHGLTAESTAADIVRGTVENITFFMKDIDDAIRSTGMEPTAFAISGGLASISYLVQVQADILLKDITVRAEQQVSALGAAFLAGMQQGTWNPSDIRKLVSGGETYKPEKNPGLEHRYRRWKELHRMTRELDRI